MMLKQRTAGWQVVTGGVLALAAGIVAAVVFLPVGERLSHDRDIAAR
jgi:hypothetical protein